MSGAQRAEMAAVVPLCSPRVNGGRRCVVVAERPSGLSACAAKVSARQAAASGWQRRSERERAHSSALRARRQRREEEGGERMGTLVNDFDSIQNQNFQLKLENLEYKSCSKCQNLQLLFQAFSHLRFGLKVTNSNLNAQENYPIHIVFF